MKIARKLFHILPRSIKSTLKNRKSAMVVLCGLIFAIGGIYYFTNSMLAARAAWFNDNWLYRTHYEIGGSADTNKKLKIDIDTATLITAGKLQSDCGDSRFTDINGKILPYYIDAAGGACNNVSTDYYILVDTFYASGTVLYHYYGNPSAENGTEAAQFSQSTYTPSSGPTAGSEAQNDLTPVLYWSFNEGYGTATQDSTAQDNDGTITNAVWSDFLGSGNQGKSLQFDGSGDYVSRSYSSDTELDPGTGDFTLSVWFRHNSNQTASGGDYLVSRHNTAGYKLFMNENEQICFGGDDDATFTSAGTCSLLDYDDSQWHHAVAVKDSTTEYLYIDGVLVDTDTAEAGSHSGSSPTLYVGIDSDGASRSWQGWIDEVKIFDTALTAAQVKAQFASSADVKGVSASFGPDDSWLTKGLVGYWKMDETSWTNDCLTTSPVTDASGNSNNGMACPASTGPTGGAAGKFGKAGEFDGVDDRVNAGSGQMLDDLTTFTYCAWIYPRSMGESNDGFIISKSLSTGSTKVLQIRSGTTNSIAFDVDRATTNSDAVSTANTLTLNTWQHVCGTYNEADGPKVYKEGVEVSYSSKIVGAGATTNDNSRDLIIGNRGNSQRTFDGFIDEARVYNRVLSPVEIQRLSEWGPGPVLYYKFDENTGTITVNDSSVNSNSGTMANMASTVWAPGKYSSSLDFDGTNDYVSAGDASLLKITGPITVSAWINRSSSSGTDRIISKLADVGQRSYWLTADNSDTAFNISADGSAVSATATTSTVIGADTWTHVAGMYDGSQIKLFLNGILVGSNSYSSGIYNSTAPFIVGSDNESSPDPFDGFIDDVRVYNYARTQKQLIEDMNGGHPFGGSPVGSPVGYWKMDEGYGDTAYDLGTGANNGNLGGGVSCPGQTICPARTNDGKFDRALSFSTLDGDYVDIADQDYFSPSVNDLSVSFWSKIDSGQGLTGHDACGGTGARFLSKSTTSVWEWDFENDKNTLVCANFTNSGTAPYATLSYNMTVDDGNWHHYLFSIDYGNRADLYIDGIKRDSETSFTGTMINDTGKVRMGNSVNTGVASITGLIDEVKIFTSAMTDDEVRAEYNRGKSAVLGSTSADTTGSGSTSDLAEYCPPGDTDTCVGPIVYYELNENTGTSTTYDSSSDGESELPATMYGTMTQTDWVPGIIGSALEFDGTDDYLHIPTAAGLGSDFSISAWFNVKTFSGVDAQLPIYTESYSTQTDVKNYLMVDQATQTVYFDQFTPTSGFAASSTVIQAGTWYHVEAVQESSSSRKLYIDGLLESTATEIYTGTAPNQFSIARRLGTALREFAGKLDDIRLYSYARTPSQVAWDYSKGKAQYHYKLDECEGTTAYNSAVTFNDAAAGNNGTIVIGSGGTTSAGTCSTSGAWFNGATGKRGVSLDFDGTDDYVIGSNTALITGTNQTYTTVSFGAWVNPGSSPTSDTIIHKDNEFRLTTDANAKPQCEIYSGSWQPAAVSSVALTASSWSHVACVYNGSTIKVYVNGRERGTIAETDTITSSSTTGLNIARDSAASGYFDGLIDEVKIWNYNLFPTQIKTEYNNGAVSFE